MNRLCISVILFAGFFMFTMSGSAYAAPSINSVTDNRSAYPSGQIPKFKKIEITFQLSNIQATNVQLPFLAASGASPFTTGFANQGISVDAVFTSPNGQTYMQPGFYYEDFSNEVRNNQPWRYSTGQFSWKIRFTPDREGLWSYKIIVRDAGGTNESPVSPFTVSASASHGFVQISKSDPRYFEYKDGTYFPGLGVNVNLGQLSDESTVATYSQKDIKLLRAWVAPFGIYGTSWSHWRTMPVKYGGYLPIVPVLNSNLEGVEQMYFYVAENSSWFTPCIFVGHEQPIAPVKPGTNYYGTVTFDARGVNGPRVAGKPFGFVTKIGGWLDNCRDSTTGTLLTPHETNTNGFKTIHFSWNSGTANYLPMFYLALENANSGQVFIKSISLKEMTGGTVQNPQLSNIEVFDKPNPQEQLYMSQRRSFELDTILDLAQKHDIYIRPVVEEKNEHIFQKLDDYGIPRLADSNQNYYGNGRTLTGTLFLHEAWWRYLQARWGYSPNIHSWELLNEGDPGNTGHFILADEFGKFMKCRVFGTPVTYADSSRCAFDHPNTHPVSTSFWHSFPANQFWKNTIYPNVDIADVHAYISTSYAPDNEKIKMQDDTAYYHTWHSADLGGWKVGKPIIRGEAGLDIPTSQDPDSLGIQNDTQGVWLHNFLWAGLHYGGLIESYWWVNQHINNGVFDHRDQYKYYSQFIKSIPLNAGGYVDIAAAVTNPNIRIVGQKNLPRGNAHLWVQNIFHTWKNVINNAPIPPQSASITISGFQPNKQYTLEEWSTQAGIVKQTSTVSANTNGTISLSVSNLLTDTAYKIINPELSPTPTTGITCTNKPKGDADCKPNGAGKNIDIADFEIWRKEYFSGCSTSNMTTTSCQTDDDGIGTLMDANFDSDTTVTVADFEIWRKGYFGLI